MPTDRRTRSSGTSSAEPAVDACVIAPGCSMSDSTPPSDSASVKISVRVQKSQRRLSAAGEAHGDHAAETAHLRGRDLVARMVGADPGRAPW